MLRKDFARFNRFNPDEKNEFVSSLTDGITYALARLVDESQMRSVNQSRRSPLFDGAAMRLRI
jgi:hypothetical protein